MYAPVFVNNNSKKHKIKHIFICFWGEMNEKAILQ